jgi:hypothetical protein
VYQAAMTSDALLTFFPLRTFRQLKNQPRLRRRLQFIFAASALTTCASIVSGAFNLSDNGFGYSVVALIEVHHVLSSPSPSPYSSDLLFPFGWTAPVMLTSSLTLFTNADLGRTHSL